MELNTSTSQATSSSNTYPSKFKKEEQHTNKTVEEILLSIMVRLDKQEKYQENLKKDVMVRLTKLENGNTKEEIMAKT